MRISKKGEMLEEKLWENYYFLCSSHKYRITTQGNPKNQIYNIIMCQFVRKSRKLKSDDVVVGLFEVRAFAQELYS